jgi:NifU-like protein
LPPEKMHCSVMGMEALHAAVANYRGETLEDDHEEGELICKCFAIDDLMIKRTVHANNLTSLEEVINYTKAGGACSSCHEKIEYVLEDCLKEMAIDSCHSKPASSPRLASVKPLTEAESERLNDKIELIETVIAEVRPGIVADGGDIQLVDIEDNIVFISLTGSCTGCGLSGLTLANVEHKISKALGEAVTVFPVQDSGAEVSKKEGTYDV